MNAFVTSSCLNDFFTSSIRKQNRDIKLLCGVGCCRTTAEQLELVKQTDYY